MYAARVAATTQPRARRSAPRLCFAPPTIPVSLLLSISIYLLLSLVFPDKISLIFPALKKRAVSTPEPSFPSREFSRAASEERAWNSPMASSGSAAERRLKLDESILTQQHDVASHARLSSLLQEVTQSALFSRSGHTWCTHCSLLCHRLITSPRR